MLVEIPENNKTEKDQEGSDTFLGYDSDGKVSPFFDAVALEMDIEEWDEDSDVPQDKPDKNLPTAAKANEPEAPKLMESDVKKCG